MTERRAVPRVEPQQGMKAKVKTSLPARIVDISSRGVQIEVTNSLRPQVTCDIRIRLDDGEVTLRAMVGRCRAWGFGVDEAGRQVLIYRAGLEFEEIDPETLARLSRNIFFDSSAPVEPEMGSPNGAATATGTDRVGTAPVQAPHRDGPVKIRISADSIRKLRRGTKQA
ncbi:MAG: PilZ domain-containing protein [Thermoanaerobaculales bacterium]